MMAELYLKKPLDLELKSSDALPPLQPNQIRIRLLYGGICGSDLSVYSGKLAYARYPLRPGHELVGRIAATGREVSLSVGTKVVVTPNSFCGKCSYCLNGKPNICSEKRSFGINEDGGFAHEIIVDASYVYPVSESVSDEAAVLIEPLAVIVHGFNRVPILPKTAVLIVGCGTEGLLAASLASYIGADVTAVDINPKKLKMLEAFKEIETMHPSKAKAGAYDVVIEAAGTKQAVESCFTWLKPGGSLLLLGITPEASIPVAQVVRNEQTIVGSIIYDFPADFEKSIYYLKDRHFNPTVFISKIYPYTDYRQAYEMALTGNYAKILLDFKEDDSECKS
ncbi:sorbitol dehydrogenase [Shouchella clausii]|jgi:L-iditol 2-dehydrogenase|uniref:zinc-dependent alcohol dehydrogenase n=2 Tax=Shouchella clausii TaxID=79880 RepID=UPI000BA60602|nr:sorbitol dehydrogenase [Shouchella clausii]PAE78788.1 sorbitol dehydrogenase [Shouchella clausii]PAF03610.1 sorbitol dehydrogenase [Shouchella clausii]PAF12386.1 sorbitol dehydrogenase [Shouchella clausii]